MIFKGEEKTFKKKETKRYEYRFVVGSEEASRGPSTESIGKTK